MAQSQTLFEDNASAVLVGPFVRSSGYLATEPPYVSFALFTPDKKAAYEQYEPALVYPVLVQSSTEQVDWIESFVVYASVEGTPTFFARKRVEFLDGRFERVP